MKHAPDPEINLNPGDFFFGDHAARVRTVLGSCVSITMWHGQRRIGGMCHYMLPERGQKAARQLDGRYAEDALALFLLEIEHHGTEPQEYEVKLFGGGRMFAGANSAPQGTTSHIGQRNIAAGRRLLQEHGFDVQSEHLAGIGHRNLLFDLTSGKVWLKHVSTPPTLSVALAGNPQSN